LSSPIPRGVKSAGFDSTESRAGATDVVFTTNDVQGCSKVERIGLLCVVFEIASAGVLQVTGIELIPLSGELAPLCLEFEELLGVHHDTSSTPGSGTIR